MSQMFISFPEYLNEMAQSRDHGSTGTIPIDDFDKDFIEQALKADPRITPVTALRTRYTLLLQDKPNDGDMVRFFGLRKITWIYAKIDRIHLKELQDKLKNAGFLHAANHGFAPSNEELNATDHKNEFYQDAFGNQNAKDSLKQGFISINARIKTVTKVSSSAMAKFKQNSEETQDKLMKTIPPNWALTFKYKNQNDAISDSGENFSNVLNAVETLVPEYITPEIWKAFKERLPSIGRTIYNAIINKLKEWHEGALDAPYEIKQYMMQVTAELLNTKGHTSANQSGKLWLDSPGLIYSDAIWSALRTIRHWQNNIKAKGSYNKFQAGNKHSNYNNFAPAIIDPNIYNNDDDNNEKQKPLELKPITNAMKSILAKVDAAGGDPEVARLTDDEYDKWRKYTNIKNKYDKMAQDKEEQEEEQGKKSNNNNPAGFFKTSTNRVKAPAGVYLAKRYQNRHDKPFTNYYDHLFTTFDQFLTEMKDN